MQFCTFIPFTASWLTHFLPYSTTLTPPPFFFLIFIFKRASLQHVNTLLKYCSWHLSKSLCIIEWQHDVIWGSGELRKQLSRSIGAAPKLKKGVTNFAYKSGNEDYLSLNPQLGKTARIRKKGCDEIGNNCDNLRYYVLGKLLARVANKCLLQ